MTELNFKEQLKNIKAFVFDVDGVFSSSKMYLNPDGEMLRSTNIKDGYSIFHARRMNFPIAIISGGSSDATRKRFEYLGVEHIYLSSKNKLIDFENFLSKVNLKAEDILYMGDDLPDYPVMKLVGIATCPADAAVEIKSIAKYISNKKGGEACVRDVVEQVLRSQGKWMNAESFTW